jgi:hypothetical protein
MTERAARGAPFLSGLFTRGEVVYADPGGGDANHREPVAIFTGDHRRGSRACVSAAPRRGNLGAARSGPLPTGAGDRRKACRRHRGG